MAKAGGWVRVEAHGEVREEPTSQELGTRFYDLDDDDSVPELGGLRPAPLGEPRPQEWVQRHTVEQIIETFVPVQILDDPVPLMVDQLVEVLQFFDTLSPVVAKQVIDVPKISLEDIPTRTPVREPQLAEQLVEVPTVPVFVEQDVDIPVPSGDLQGSRPGQGSAASSPSHSPAGVLEDANEPVEGFFRTFPRPKKSAEVTRQWSARELRHSSSSTLSAHQMAPGTLAVLGCQDAHGVVRRRARAGVVPLRGPSGRSFWRLLTTDHSQWEPPWERKP